MKSIIIIIAISFSSLQLFASQVIFTNQNSARFSIEYNGTKFNSTNGQISINQVNAGFNNFKVITTKHKNGQTIKVVSHKKLQIPANSIVYATVYKNNDIAINSSERIQTNSSHYAPQKSNSRVVQSTPRPTYYKSNEYCNTNLGMNQREFNRLYNDLQRMHFDSDKFLAAKRAIRNNNFTAAQVYDLVELFNFEDYRLQIAKLAFNNTVDQYNYDQVFNLLHFNSSKRNLDNYIAQNTVQQRHYENREAYSYYSH